MLLSRRPCSKEKSSMNEAEMVYEIELLKGVPPNVCAGSEEEVSYRWQRLL